MSEFKSEAEIVEQLRARISFVFKQKDLAAELSISQAYVSAILIGNRPLPARILKKLGYDAKPHYRKQAVAAHKR